MPLLVPTPPIFSGTSIADNAMPLNMRQRVVASGSRLLEIVQKRTEETLDYFCDMENWLEPDEDISACTAWVDADYETTGYDAPACAANSNVDQGLYIDRLNFSTDGLLIWLRGGGNERRYMVNVRFETSRSAIKLLRFKVVTTGDSPTILFDDGGAVRTVVKEITDAGYIVGTKDDARKLSWTSGSLATWTLENDAEPGTELSMVPLGAGMIKLVPEDGATMASPYDDGITDDHNGTALTNGFIYATVMSNADGASAFWLIGGITAAIP